jgi:PleD family two-component response regulator
MEQLFEHADAALYERKEAGRKGCSFYQPQRKQG